MVPAAVDGVADMTLAEQMAQMKQTASKIAAEKEASEKAKKEALEKSKQF
jgi:hypothetical protein